VPDWRKFCVLLNGMRAQDAWRGQLARVRRWYKQLLKRRYTDADARLADLDQLEKIAAGYETRRQFLTDLTLDPPDSTTNTGRNEDRDSTVLSTIHSAKGREWQVVRILSVVDGCIPSSRAKGAKEIDEERRLLFVAMTRAKNELELVVPQHNYFQSRHGGYGSHHVLQKRSQFVPRSISDKFRHVRYRRNNK
jgi:DNA helicase-2/ATP-dependent DNA helicase PcrA